MHGEGFFYQAFVYLTAAAISVPIAKRLGLGSVLGYLIAGVVIGPFGLSFVGAEGQDVMHFAEFGVVMMLFLVGLELQPSRLWQMRGPILGMGGLQVGITAAVGTALAMAAGMIWQTALAVGMILSLSSTAIVLQTLQEKNLFKTDAGQSCFSVLLFQDISVIPMLAVLPLLATTSIIGGHPGMGGSTMVTDLPGWLQTIVVFAVVAAVVLAGRFLARHVFRYIARTRLREIFTAAALTLVIGVALLMTKIGLSPALGTFTAGVVLANNEYRHELESNIDPFKGLLLAVFFIAVGASIDFRLVVSQPGFIAAVVVVLLLTKWVILFAVGRFCKMGLDQNLLFAFALAQSGEFAFVLFSFSVQSGVIPADLANRLIVVVAISMALTPVFWLVNEKIIQPRTGTRTAADREPDVIEEANPVIIAGFGRFGSIVGRLLRANGVRATVLEYDSDHVELLRNLGFQVYYGDASRLDLLHAAGAAQAELLVLAIDDHEKIMEIIQTVKKHFPGLRILARANGRPQAYELLEAGVEHVYRETLDTSLKMAVDALHFMGVRRYHAHRASITFRKHDEDSVRELALMRHDHKAYMTTARQRIQDLEQILLAESQDTDKDLDAAWDTESLLDEYGKPAD